MKLKKFTSMIMVSTFLFGLMANSTFAKMDFKQKDAALQLKTNGSVEMTVKFKDMKDALWAFKHVSKMASQDIVKGYTDGSFKPNKPVTQAEAVVLAMKAAGYQEEVESVTDSVYLPFKDSSKLPQWAQKSISLAAAKGIIESGSDVDFQSNKPATRQWTAKMIIKAFGLDEEAAAKADVALPFKDADSISADAVGYIAVALERNIIAGMPDGTFQPNKPVTRAQIAVMLGLTSTEQEIKSDDQLSGNIKEVSVTEDVYSQGSITIETKKLDSVTIPVAKDAVIYIGENKTSLDKLAAGTKVEIIVKNGVAVFIETQTESVKGVIQSVNGQTVNVQVKEEHQSINKSLTAIDDVKVVINGKQAELDDLQSGSYAKLTLGVNDTVTEIRACKLEPKVIKKAIEKKAEKIENKIEKTENKIQEKAGKGSQNDLKQKQQKDTDHTKK